FSIAQLKQLLATELTDLSQGTLENDVEVVEDKIKLLREGRVTHVSRCSLAEDRFHSADAGGQCGGHLGESAIGGLGLRHEECREVFTKTWDGIILADAMVVGFEMVFKQAFFSRLGVVAGQLQGVKLVNKAW
ncbi:hypothetical protein J3B02_004433, partial [Coemansia erecta]